jgi:hypothetical protein
MQRRFASLGRNYCPKKIRAHLVIVFQGVIVMRCLPALALALLAFSAAHANDENATIIVDQVAVQSGKGKLGPGAYYVTGHLNRGTRVTVELQPENGFYAIRPPEGSYDLISKHDVNGHMGHVKVTKDNAEITIGSHLKTPDDNPTRALLGGLRKKADVVIIGPLEHDHYPIRPDYSLRYVPVGAVQVDSQDAIAQLPTAKPPPPDHSLDPEGYGDQSADPNTQQKLTQAEQMYRNARANNQPSDWTAAQQLYEELARSPNADVRLTALNRLEFIRMRHQPAAYAGNNGFRSGRYEGSASTTGSQPRAASNYAYAQDSGPARLAPLTQPPPVAAPAPAPPVTQPPVAAPPTYQPVNQVRNAPAPPQTASGAKEFGQLIRTSSTAAGRPVYYLKDSAGNLKCYVIPADGVPLDSYLGQNVEVSSNGPMTYHGELRAYMLTASHVTPMNR